MKRTLVFIVVVIMAFCCPGTAFSAGDDIVMSGSCGPDLLYTVTQDGLLTITGTGEMQDYTNTKGSENPFQNGASSSRNRDLAIVKHIVIGEGVTSIGKYAFAWCFNLESIDMPDSLTSIGLSAFDYCYKIKDLHIPKGVTDISGSAFFYSTFETISVDPDNPVYFAAGNCLIERETRTLIAGTKNSVIPDDGSVVKIGYGAFAYKIGESVYIPAAITALSAYSLGSPEDLPKVSVCYGGTKEQWDAMTKKELDPANHRRLKNVYIGHNYKRTAVAEADCLNAGENHCVCLNCGFESTETVPALGHDAVSVGATEPTCVKSGLTEGSVCARCGTILTAQEVIPAAGHDFTNKRTTEKYRISAATCTSPAKYYYSCVRCAQKDDTVFEAGTSLGHSFTRKMPNNDYLKSAASCTSPAVYYYACIRCDAAGTDTFTDGSALGHTWTESERIKEPTCEKSGKIKLVCPVCGETKTEELPATGHDYVVFENKAPDCSEDGYVIYICKNNSRHTKKEILKKTSDHVDDDGDGYCDRCRLVVGQIRGDIDGLGEVTAWDARLALRFSAKLERLTDKQQKIADVNEDGQVLADDARQILRFSARLQQRFEKKTA